MNEIVKTSNKSKALANSKSRSLKEKETVYEQVYVTIYVHNQLFGIPVESVKDILVPEKIANIPLAPKEIAGAINLRGRIVTVVDVRTRLGLPPKEDDNIICTTVELGHELYSLKVDKVGAVIPLTFDKIEKNPSTLHPRWRSISAGVVRLKEELMIVLDIESLLNFTK
ncbi:MAG: Chemotaxis protein CheW [Alphaproteobacteria bacterium ADurb.Bin438]|nr:MAG: Chemotaxis protein CheW [Alphaproteobacteria bacterium ADurb.Bin438]